MHGETVKINQVIFRLLNFNRRTENNFIFLNVFFEVSEPEEDVI
jgi:hypothetical protein